MLEKTNKNKMNKNIKRRNGRKRKVKTIQKEKIIILIIILALIIFGIIKITSKKAIETSANQNENITQSTKNENANDNEEKKNNEEINDNNTEEANNNEDTNNNENTNDDENANDDENTNDIEETKNNEKIKNNEEINDNNEENINNKGLDSDIKNNTKPVYKKSEKNIKIPILIYHNFRTPIPYEQDIYKLFSNQENFDENVKTLLDAGYTFITLEDLYRYNNNEIGLPEKVVIITMDDGQIGCYTEAFPILKKYNIPATIFIVNNLVGTEDYFSWEQAKEMYETGLVKIHCHGYNHSEYSSVGKEKLISDYTKSHQEIEEKMGEKIQKIMAYPAGKSSKDTIKWLKEIGFEVQVQTRYGTINKSENLDLTNLGRIRAERATGKQLLASIK